MCDTPPSSLDISESIDVNEKNAAISLDEVATSAIEKNTNETKSMQITSSNSCHVVTNDRSTRNSLKIAGTPVSSMYTRSRDNPEFVAKHKNFIAQVQAANLGIDGHVARQEPAVKRKRDSINSPQPTAKKKKVLKPDSSNYADWQNDSCCWECHREGQFICCEMCPRVFHLKCVDMEKEPEDDWACHECHAIMLAENVENRSRAMQLISVDQLCVLLKFALSRLTASPALSPFCNPVDTTEFPLYKDVIVHPLDLQTLEKNIKKKLYGSTEAFFVDARWIYHNSVIFNGANSKVTSLAKTLIKILRQELSEIETCPDCYQNAHLKPDSWFTEACRLAHPLVWAKLKGFPYWPAKAVKWKEGNVDVRFFGRHDRSWVPLKDCYLYTEQMPTALKSRNKTLETCMMEVKKHIDSLQERFGEFKYAPPRVVYNPHDTEQIKILLPLYKGPTILKIKPSFRTPSRQSHSGTDDETSSVTSSDSCSIYNRKRSLLSSLQLSETQSNQDESDLKTDDGMEGAESDKGDLDCDSRAQVKIPEGQCNETDKNIDNDAAVIVKAIDEYCDKAFDPAEAIKPDESLAKDGSINNTEELSHEMDIDSKPITASDSNSGTEEVTPSAHKSTTADITDDASNVGSTTKVELNNLSLFTSSPISIKQVVEVDPMLLDDELGIELTPKKSASLIRDTTNPDSPQKGITQSNSSDGQPAAGESIMNESVLKLECINALLASTITDVKDKLDVHDLSNQPASSSSDNGDNASESDHNVAHQSKIAGSPTKSDSMRSSVDEDSFQGFFSSDPEKEKAESCRNILKSFRMKSFILNEDHDSDVEHHTDASNCENINRQSPATNISTAEKEKPSATPDTSACKDIMEGTVSKAAEIDREKDLASSQCSVIKKGSQSVTHVSSSNDRKTESVPPVSSSSDLQDKLPAVSISQIRKSNPSAGENTIPCTMVKVSESEKLTSGSKSSPNGKSVNTTTIANSPNAKVLLQNSSITVAKLSPSKPSLSSAEVDLPMEMYPSLKIAKVTSLADLPESQITNVDDSGSDSVIEEEEEDPLMICESPPAVDIESYATKMFHNVTISKSADCRKSSQRLSRSVSSDIETSVVAADSIDDTLSAAVKLVQNIGNIAVKRLDSRTMEHASGNDRVTISVADNAVPRHERAAPRSVKEARKGAKTAYQVKHQLTALGGSVSVGKPFGSKTETTTTVKVPSGVDTTRLSPSISILPVAGGSAGEKQKVRCLLTASIPAASASITTPPAATTSVAKSSSPLVSAAGRITPSSSTISAPPNLPPPLSSHPSSSSAGGNIRGMLGTTGHLPHLQGYQNGPRVPMSAPSMRMMVPNAAMIMANRMPGHVMRPSPPEAGPLSAELGKHSMKLAEMMRASLEEVIGGLVGVGSPEAKLAALQLELERCNWRHQQEMADVRHNADVMLVEMRASMEVEKQRGVDEVRKQGEQKLIELRRTFELQMTEKISDVRKQSEGDKHRAMEETKKKQWCANCQKEALLFCCWNTSYCDYPCQQNHWPQHMSVCGQNSEHGNAPRQVSTGDMDMEVANGNTSGQSSGLSTPVHSNVGSQFTEEDAHLSIEERRRKRRKEIASPIFTDSLPIMDPMAGSIISSNMSSIPVVSINKPMTNVAQGLMMPHMNRPPMPLGLIGSSPPIGMHMKMPRFLQHSPMQPQQAMYGAMDPRMMMLIGQRMGNPSILRSPLQQFRPRFM